MHDRRLTQPPPIETSPPVSPPAPIADSPILTESPPLVPEASNGSDNRVYVCHHEGCHYRSNRKNNLKRHILTMHEKVRMRDKVNKFAWRRKRFWNNKVCQQREETKLHFSICFQVLPPQVCCDIEFTRKATYREHVRKHHRDGYRCPQEGCDRMFIRRALLERHMSGVHKLGEVS